MRLLKLDDSDNLVFEDFFFRPADRPPYAILSHTWGADHEELKFQDVKSGDYAYKTKAGYRKVEFCGRRAKADGLDYFWVDSCCIDKTNGAELAESVISMFEWYRKAQTCYVFLADVSVARAGPSTSARDSWMPAFRASRWHTRGWTLQELVAPSSVEFFSREEIYIGNKASLMDELHSVTAIDKVALQGSDMSLFSIDDRFAWAGNRKTTRPEDLAYCLFGIFGVSLPVLYGEGAEKAKKRLRDEVYKSPRTGAQSQTCAVPFDPNPDFVERGDLFQKILGRCLAPRSRTALVGLGGIGKSQLAIQCGHRVRSTSPSTWVFWVHASNAARFKQGFRDIADQAQLPGRDSPETNVLVLVHKWLTRECQERWLLILDNLDDPSLLEDTSTTMRQTQGDDSDDSPVDLLDYVPISDLGSLLVTSRFEPAAMKIVSGKDIIFLGQMDQQDAVDLLQKKLETSDSKDINALASAVDFIPLAMVQAAAFITQRKRRGYSVDQYLAELGDTQKRAELLSWESPDVKALGRDDKARNAATSTWLLTFNTIRRDRPSAATLLSLMSFFDRQGIPKSVLSKRNLPTPAELKLGNGISSPETSTLGSDADYCDTDFDNDIDMLGSYTLISFQQDAPVYSMHRLVQVATQEWLQQGNDYAKLESLFITNLWHAFPDGREVTNWPECENLYPHARAALARPPTESRNRLDWAFCMTQVSRFPRGKGDSSKELEFTLPSSPVFQETLGDRHATTIEAMIDLGFAYKVGGRLTQAEKLQMMIQPISQQVLGETHQLTLRNTTYLAYTYQALGNLEAAEALVTRVLEIQKTVLNEDDPDMVTSMATLASIYDDQGRLDAARELLDQVLHTRQKILGDDHPNTLASMYTLALVYNSQGDTDAAEKLLEETIEAEQRVLGRDHRETVASLSALASVYFDQGRLDAAEEIQTQMLDVRRRTLGERHPDTLISMHNLAFNLVERGRVGEGEQLLSNAFDLYVEVLGKEHSSTLRTMQGLARVVYKGGREAEGLAQMEECLALRTKTLGAEHWDTLSTMHDLGSWMCGNDRQDEGLGLLEECLALRTKTLGVEDKRKLVTMHQLATYLYGVGRRGEGLTLMEECVALETKRVGAEHPDTLASARVLAAWREEQDAARSGEERHQPPRFRDRAFGLIESVQRKAGWRLTSRCKGRDARTRGRSGPAT